MENTLRETEEFGTRVAGLQKVFQQHLRDVKEDVLPGIIEALTEDEAKSVVDQFETQIAEVAAAKRAAALGRRAEARLEREKTRSEADKTGIRSTAVRSEGSDYTF